MREIHFMSSDVHQLITDVMESDFPVFILELRGVYGLVAPHSAQGVNALNRAKERKPGKYYGSLAGNLEPLMTITPPNSIVRKPAVIPMLEGCFIRFKTDAPGLNETRCQGTHQVLIEHESIRALALILENATTQTNSKQAIIPYPLCTSANMSGDPNGSITNESEALTFGVKRHIPLFIHTGMKGNDLGSYPIIEELADGRLRIVRQGPNGEETLRNLQSLI